LQLSEQLEETRSRSQAAELKHQKQLAELHETLEAVKRENSQLIAEGEATRGSLDLLQQQLDLVKDEVADRQERIERLESRRDELAGQLERARAAHDEEMGEMIDVVNDLKVKEDELAGLHKDLANQNRRIDELCKQLLSQEQSHKVPVPCTVGWNHFSAYGQLCRAGLLPTKSDATLTPQHCFSKYGCYIL
jgi:seryl-tRNA synthetase